MPKVVVYLRAADERLLRALGEEDPALWVRKLIARAIAKRREQGK